MNPNKIICPNCKNEISIDEAFSHQIEDNLTKKLREEFNQKWLDEKRKLEKNITENSNREFNLLKEQFEKQRKELDQAREYELKLRKKTQELEEKEKNLELEKERQIDEERKKIQEKTETDITEKFHLKEKEKDSLIESLKKSLEDAQRKANQGSQQLQGEVLELELEEILKREFPIDEINEVSKGRLGADILQTVRDSNGRNCGIIVWESKRTKNFEESWIDKLKEDMREAKADMAILVSIVLPKEMKIFGYKNGVHIVSFESFLQVAQIMRKSLIDLNNTKALSVGKNEKIESLYRYITSSEFAQKIESMMEVYKRMKETLDREKTALTKVWAQREKEIDRLKNNTLAIHGSLAGLIDEPLVEVKSTEFPIFEESEDEL